MEIKISRLGFGAWQLGNNQDWGNMDETSAIALVQEAYKEGINFFDTAPHYAGGKSEEYLGKAVKKFRDKIYINSKIDYDDNGTGDHSLGAIERSVRGSLKRLQTTYLDSVLLHNPPMYVLEGKTEDFSELEKLKDMGIIRAYGASIDTREEVKAILENKQIGVIELLYNVFFQSCRDLLPEIHKRGIILIIKVPLDSGWLSGKYSIDSSFSGIRSRWSKEIIERRGALVSKLVSITKDPSLTKYAMGFLWSYPEITTVIPGIKNMQQLHEHLEARKFVFAGAMKRQFEIIYDQQISHNPLPW